MATKKDVQRALVAQGWKRHADGRWFNNELDAWLKEQGIDGHFKARQCSWKEADRVQYLRAIIERGQRNDS